MTDLHDTLTIFKLAIDMLQGNKYPTINLSCLFYAEVKESLEVGQQNQSNSVLKNKMFIEFY